MHFYLQELTLEEEEKENLYTDMIIRRTTFIKKKKIGDTTVLVCVFLCRERELDRSEELHALREKYLNVRHVLMAARPIKARAASSCTI